MFDWHQMSHSSRGCPLADILAATFFCTQTHTLHANYIELNECHTKTMSSIIWGTINSQFQYTVTQSPKTPKSCGTSCPKICSRKYRAVYERYRASENQALSMVTQVKFKFLKLFLKITLKRPRMLQTLRTDPAS